MRKSKLAQWQTNHVIERLQDAWPDLTCEKVTFVTQGDKTPTPNRQQPVVGWMSEGLSWKG